MKRSHALAGALTAAFAGFVATLAADTPKTDEPAARVSYFKDVRPVFAQHCNGCHQPAKPMGGFVMTEHADLLKAGEREKAGVVPGKPDQSYLLEQIRLHPNGKAEMPKGRDPLTAAQVKLVADWIAQGAADDTPASAKAVAVDRDHPPKYALPPVVTSLAFSPDGKYLAVSGYHEVLLYTTENYALESRLIGISERIQSLAFSPDGKFLAAAGGSPGRFGEVQVWAHAEETLVTSGPVTFDTVYGVSWSPDGKKLAFGCADNTVRAIDPATGKQVLFMGTHGDWVLGTAFSQDGEHLVSVSRDMTIKLTEVATQRFVDNVTTITPGRLKGGLMAVDRRPLKEKKVAKVPDADDGGKVTEKVYDEVLAAGSDGIPRLYKIHREKKRVIGDDFNFLKAFAELPGRVSCVKFDATGDRFAAASSLDGKGEVRVYTVADGKAVKCDVTGPAYAVAWHPDGKRIASAGFDGKVWLHDAATGKLVREFVALPGSAKATEAQ